MAVKTLQITQTGSAAQVSATPIKCKWAAFQNTAAAVMRVGDANVSTTRGVSLAASGGLFSVPVSTTSTYAADLSQWWTVGTSTQVLDVVYDDETFTA
jgi:hypothetical protein